MADNVNVTQGTGTLMATDEIAGVQYPRVKPSFGVDGTAVDVSTSNPLPVVQTGASALPTGASTAANQATEISSLASIDTKLTSPLTVDVANFPGTQPVSGSVAVTNFPATQPVSGTVAVSNFPATQPVSAAALPLPSGASTSALQNTGNASLGSIDTKLTSQATAAKQDTGNASLASIDTKLTNPLPVSGSVTVGGTVGVSNFPATQPVSAAALPLPTGAATAANQATQATAAKQDTGNTSLANIDAGTPAALGQTTMAASMPVVLASDQTSVPTKIGPIASAGGTYGALTIGTSAALACSNGSSNLANRSTLTIFNNSISILYWGFDSSVTTSTGTPIQPNMGLNFFASDLASINIYLIAGGTGNNVRVTEI